MARFHPHRSTWILCATAVAVFIGINACLDGDRNSNVRFYGWPWAIIEWEEHTLCDFISSSPVCELIKPFDFTVLIANSLVGLAISLPIVALWEGRCRRRTRWFQFTLLDGLIFVTIFAAILSYRSAIYRDLLNDYQLRQCLMTDEESSVDEEFIGFDGDYHHNCPAWVCTALATPQDQRPLSRWRIELANSDSKPEFGDLIDLPVDAARILPQYQRLTTLDLRGLRVSAEAWQSIGDIPSLQILNLVSVPLREDSLRPFATTSPLRAATIEFSSVTDDTFAAFATCKNLSELQFRQVSQFQGHRLAEFPELRQLHLSQTDVDDQGLQAIARLPKLRELHIGHCDSITPGGWTALAAHPTLQYLTIVDSPFDAEAAEAVSRLPSLTSLTLENISVSDAVVQYVTQHKTLRELYISDHRGSLTDDSLYWISWAKNLRRCTIKVDKASPEALAAVLKTGLEVEVHTTANNKKYHSHWAWPE